MIRSNMQLLTTSTSIRKILNIVSIALVLAAIVMELLPEDQAKIFVIPTLVAVLAAGFIQLSIYKND
jgi:hypothetical protein